MENTQQAGSESSDISKKIDQCIPDLYLDGLQASLLSQMELERQLIQLLSARELIQEENKQTDELFQQMKENIKNVQRRRVDVQKQILQKEKETKKKKIQKRNIEKQLQDIIETINVPEVKMLKTLDMEVEEEEEEEGMMNLVQQRIPYEIMKSQIFQHEQSSEANIRNKLEQLNHQILYLSFEISILQQFSETLQKNIKEKEDYLKNQITKKIGNNSDNIQNEEKQINQKIQADKQQLAVYYRQRNQIKVKLTQTNMQFDQFQNQLQRLQRNQSIRNQKKIKHEAQIQLEWKQKLTQQRSQQFKLQQNLSQCQIELMELEEDISALQHQFQLLQQQQNYYQGQLHILSSQKDSNCLRIINYSEQVRDKEKKIEQLKQDIEDIMSKITKKINKCK